MEIKDILKKENNEYLKGFKYTALDGTKFDTIEEALEYNNIFYRKLSILKNEKEKKVK